MDGVIDSGFVFARPSGPAISPELAVFLAGSPRLSSQKCRLAPAHKHSRELCKLGRTLTIETGQAGFRGFWTPYRCHDWQLHQAKGHWE